MTIRNAASETPLPIERRHLCFAVVIGIVTRVVAPSAPGADESTATGAAQCLSGFGPIGTVQEAEATLREASRWLQAAGGGVLLIPPDAPAGWRPVNITQEVWRRPDPPAPATGWGIGPGVTLIDLRRGVLDLHLPQLDGMRLTRTMNLPDGQSAPHWSYHPMVRLENSIVRGAVSYRDWLQDDVESGEDRRFYVNTLRGIFPGAFLNTGDHGGVSRLYVKSLGYDTERNTGYFVADVDRDIRKGAIIHNKTHANVMRMDTYGHTEDQTFDVMNWRHDYSQGDTYMYDARFNYMGDCRSTAGDENAVLYAAFVVGDTAIFRGRVESWDAATHELKYTGARNAHTLGTGRPIINLNPDKWIAGDDLYILHPGGALLGWGGTIRSRTAPWGPEVIGRYLAIDEPDETVPNGDGVRRWYLITAFEETDGIKRLSVQRHWWGAKQSHGISRLYNPANYSLTSHEEQGKEKRLRYIIAPGANVYDVSRGTRSTLRYSAGAAERIVKLTPAAHRDSDVDFAPDDPIEQAIGPDPFRPLPFRGWLFENVPGAWPAPVFDIANRGAIQRHSALTVAGGPSALDALEHRYDKRAPWGTYASFDSTADVGILFGADVRDDAIRFMQPGRRDGPPHATDGMHLIRWHRDGVTAPRMQPSMGVDMRGRLQLRHLTAFSPMTQAAGELAGISASPIPAANLRGIRVPVSPGATELAVRFDNTEPDDAYAVRVQPSWLTETAVVARDPGGFTIRFNQAPPPDGALSWILVR